MHITHRVIVWIVLLWALATGLTVTDLFVCPWTAALEPPGIVERN